MFSRSWLPGVWRQWPTLSYVHLSKPCLRQLGEPHVSEKTFPRLGCGHGPFGPDRPSTHTDLISYKELHSENHWLLGNSSREAQKHMAP